MITDSFVKFPNEKERAPESLTSLERAWLKRRRCAWCEAPTHINRCYATVGEMSPDPTAERCTDGYLNQRRCAWLRHYKPRRTKSE